MPNWIINSVSLEGNEKQIEEMFEKHFKGDTIDFDTIIPQPKRKKDCPIKYICDPLEVHIEPCKGRKWFNWYEWNYDNWGVKWNACEGYIDGKYFFQFETPWGCPTPVLEKLSTLYPDVRFFVEVDGELDDPYSFTLKNGKGA